MNQQITHNAPAGKKYKSIRDAGEKTLAIHSDKFPQNTSNESFLLPVLFETSHPENIKSAAGLLDSDQRGLKGLEVNIHGERGEYEVYKVFYPLIRQCPAESILGLFGYKLDYDNGKGLKKRAIMNELPTIDLTGVNMRREHDAVVIVKNLGTILCEVKTSASADNLLKGEEQLHSSERFVKQVFAAIGGPTSPNLPTMKIIFVPNEKKQPSSLPMFNDCHVIYEDELSNFPAKWSQMVNELKKLAMNQSINPKHFEHLIQFIVGVWTMKPITKTSYDFENSGASLATKIANIDVAVDQQQYAPTKKAQEFTTDIATSINDVFQRANDFNILYLNPTQKYLFDYHPHALIHSHAGAGKSMLIICKIIELMESDPTQKVILIAPEPHHLRCQMIFKKHNISADILAKFPFTKPAPPTSAYSDSSVCTLPLSSSAPVNSLTSVSTDSSSSKNSLGRRIRRFFKRQPRTPTSASSDSSVCTSPPSSSSTGSSENQQTSPSTSLSPPAQPPAQPTLPASGVIIITTKNFFNVTSSELISYDLSTFNVFMDDLHSHEVDSNICTYTDIGDFIDTTYITHSTTAQYLWAACDIVQGKWNSEDKQRPDQLFMQNDGTTRTFQIPVIEMTAILRNTKEVSDVVESARDEQTNYLELDTAHVVQNISCGHYITTGDRILYEKLQQGTAYKHNGHFLCHRVCALLHTLTTTSPEQPHHNFPFGTVAVLFDDEVELTEYLPSLQQTLGTTFNIGTQTIAEQIVNNNNTDIVVDHSGNIQSFECATVVVVRAWSGGVGSGFIYNLISRARTKCVVVDVNTTDPPLPLQHVDVVEWREDNGSFVRV